MGEPLANYERVVAAVRRITSPPPDGFGISQRNVVLDAARYYADKSGRRVSIGYALIRDINDQPWRADMLGAKLHKALGSRMHVNVIPLKATSSSKWDASPKPVEREFVWRVNEQDVPCRVRDTRGQEIAAGCGQLAAEGVAVFPQGWAAPPAMKPPPPAADSARAGLASANRRR
ncbi:23S rRNA (adenine2503-C2)-methyltransferase [Nocardia tenerifensis]|uniref:23S rRNA (Adenine2503-C2)-methyltransferase n=1 Tax=Nocardia tenerifensis TaxID=228006 RepID=A0A318K0S2_9NOCA|nr:23S rRNA (adenine2503-C2)-methyltransferase [Nocardia tenerifensis]